MRSSEGRRGRAGSCRPNGPVHATPAVAGRRRSTSAGATNSSARCALADGKVLFELPLGGYTGASSGGCGGPRLSSAPSTRTSSRSTSARGGSLWRYRDPEREFPYYSSAALLPARERHDRGRRRPRQARPRDRRENRQGRLEVRHPRARRFVARHCRRPGLRRIERRQALRARRRDRHRSSGSSTSATRSPRRRPSAADAWSSARRTAGSTVSARAADPRQITRRLGDLATLRPPSLVA